LLLLQQQLLLLLLLRLCLCLLDVRVARGHGARREGSGAHVLQRAEVAIAPGVGRVAAVAT